MSESSFPHQTRRRADLDRSGCMLAGQIEGSPLNEIAIADSSMITWQGLVKRSPSEQLLFCPL